jgi:hypothetical protein
MRSGMVVGSPDLQAEMIEHVRRDALCGSRQRGGGRQATEQTHGTHGGGYGQSRDPTSVHPGSPHRQNTSCALAEETHAEAAASRTAVHERDSLKAAASLQKRARRRRSTLDMNFDGSTNVRSSIQEP